MRQRNIFNNARFFQFGLHADSFKKCPRYTYLESYDLKNVFAKTIIGQQSEYPHNICVKTPHDIAGPAFVDITTTILADAHDAIEYARTGEMPQKRHVQARSR